MRLALKIAILASGKSQRQTAAAAGLSENRLSEIVRGWADPRDDERESLARILSQPAPALFDQSGDGAPMPAAFTATLPA